MSEPECCPPRTDQATDLEKERPMPPVTALDCRTVLEFAGPAAGDDAAPPAQGEVSRPGEVFPKLLVQPDVARHPAPVPGLRWAEVVSDRDKAYISDGLYTSGHAAPCPACGTLLRTREQGGRLRRHARRTFRLGVLLFGLGVMQLGLAVAPPGEGPAAVNLLGLAVGTACAGLGLVEIVRACRHRDRSSFLF